MERRRKIAGFSVLGGVLAFNGLLFFPPADAVILSAVALVATSAVGAAVYILLADLAGTANSLKTNEATTRAILDHTFQFIGLLDVEGRLLAANPSALEFISAREGSVLGRFFWETPWWTHSATEQERLKAAVTRAAGGEFTRFETSHANASGELAHIDFSLKPVFDRGKVVFLVPEGRDITDRRRAEDQVREAKELAELANRAKSDFLANVSHELRTPLNAIIGFSEIMREEMFGALGHPRYVEYMHDISSSGRHLLQLIGDILDLSAIEVGKLEMHEETVPLRQLVSEAMLMVEWRASTRKIELKVELADPDVRIMVDARRFKQVLINIMANAVKFVPREGLIKVTSQGSAAGGLLIGISDNGSGMKLEDIERALQPFVQVDDVLTRRHEGIGLGLPLSNRLMEMHGGRMEITSRPGQGTDVRLHLPALRVIG